MDADHALPGARQIAETLERHGQLILSPVGTSMYPLLMGGRDTVVISPPRFPLRRYDVALYERPDGSLVLHRVYRAGETSCVFCGDHLTELEEDVPNAWVCGLMTGAFRRERYFSVGAWWYKLYCRVWCGGLGVRRAAKRISPYLYRMPVRLYKRVKRFLTGS